MKREVNKNESFFHFVIFFKSRKNVELQRKKESHFLSYFSTDFFEIPFFPLLSEINFF